MSLTIEAIYKNGVLNPIQPIALAKGTHVSVVITPTETPSDPKTLAEIDGIAQANSGIRL